MQLCMACHAGKAHGGGTTAQRDRRQRQLQCSRHDAHVLRRRQMVDAMFRRYGFAGVQVQIQAVLTLYSQGGLWLPQHIVICCSTKCALRITRQLEPSIPDLPHLWSHV